MATSKMDSCMDILRRLPPDRLAQNIAGLVELVPDLSEEILARVDQPLKVVRDPTANQDFLVCDYNRDGDSYRSPWSNEYFPPLPDGALPPAKLRALEVEANALFNAYRQQYFEGGKSSVYFWETGSGASDESFACCILIKKEADGSAARRRSLEDPSLPPPRRKLEKGCWDSIHVVEVGGEAKKGNVRYRLTSTVLLSLTTFEDNKAGSFNLAGSIARQVEQEHPAKDGHLVNIGQMVEEMESRLRNTVDQVYFGKTKEVVGKLCVTELGLASADADVRKKSIMSEMAQQARH
eukprot:jgi/Mesvir1/24983/Mv16946-RA.1